MRSKSSAASGSAGTGAAGVSATGPAWRRSPLPPGAGRRPWRGPARRGKTGRPGQTWAGPPRGAVRPVAPGRAPGWSRGGRCRRGLPIPGGRRGCRPSRALGLVAELGLADADHVARLQLVLVDGRAVDERAGPRPEVADEPLAVGLEDHRVDGRNARLDQRDVARRPPPDHRRPPLQPQGLEFARHLQRTGRGGLGAVQKDGRPVDEFEREIPDGQQVAVEQVGFLLDPAVDVDVGAAAQVADVDPPAGVDDGRVRLADRVGKQVQVGAGARPDERERARQVHRLLSQVLALRQERWDAGGGRGGGRLSVRRGGSIGHRGTGPTDPAGQTGATPAGYRVAALRPHRRRTTKADFGSLATRGTRAGRQGRHK